MKRILVVLLMIGCGDTGQEHVELPLRAKGTAAREVALDDARITLTRAQVSFGPAYFCASEAGRAELCEVALAEFTQSAPIDALDPSPQELGTLQATTGEVRSGLFDYGLSWLLTQNGARANPGAVEGHSALLDGTLTRGAQSLRFSVAIDVKPRMQGDLAVNGQVTRHTLREGSALTVEVDPNAWVSQLDVDALFALDGDGDGAVGIGASDAAYESILQGMVSRAPPRLQWQ
jgi:hypothetical protein